MSLLIGEHYFDGLKREIYEETGLDVTIGDPVFIGEWFSVIKGFQIKLLGFFFPCKATITTITLSSEHDHYVWINPNSLHCYSLTESDRQAIEKWQKRAL
ncbi:MAG TPA: NUDIX hydrolase [Candidatus Babeliaceae bacterium]|nr:NUDIX hydrolase [Candidatus Babeliaceae bacterium]